jgi:fido (protein-threonine AMPylation protein)
VIEASDDDSVRTYTPEEQLRITRQLEVLTREVHRGASRGRALDLDLLCSFHRALFDGVRGHAGKIRRPGFGSEYLTFGPNRSVSREVVEAELRATFARVARELPKLHDLRDDEDGQFELEAIRLAVWAHAEIIRIHPFEDGNGRSARLCAGHLLVQCGMWPVPIETVKQEYTGALNRYHETRDLDPLVDLFIQLYPVDL